MDEVMNDIGYQQSLENMIEHKMLIRDLILKDPIYMAMVFCDLLKGFLKEFGEAEVEYEGSTSVLYVKGPFTFYNMTAAMCKALASAIKLGGNDTGSFMQILVRQLIATTGQDTCTCMGILLDYVNNPIKLNGFFKIFNIASGEYQVWLN